MKIQAKFRTLWLSFHFCVAVWKTAGSRNTVTDPETGAEWCSMSSTFSPVFIFLLAENSFRERVTALCRQVRQKRTRKVRGKEQMGEKLRGFSVCRLLRGSCRSVVGTVLLWLFIHAMSVYVWVERQMLSRWHLSDVFVSQSQPQVIILIQHYLLQSRLSHPTGLETDKEGMSGLHTVCAYLRQTVFYLLK